MFNSLLIFINTSRLIPNASGLFLTSSAVYKYMIVGLALIGAYKIYKWTQLLAAKWSKRTPKTKQNKPNLTSSNQRKKSADNTESTSTSVSKDSSYNRIPLLSKKTPTESDMPRCKYTHKQPNNQRVIAQKIEELENSESLIGVATAAATAATVFLDHKRKNRCDKCSSRSKNEPQTSSTWKKVKKLCVYFSKLKACMILNLVWSLPILKFQSKINE